MWKKRDQMVNNALSFFLGKDFFYEELQLETSALETLYGGQFTLSTQLIKPNNLEISSV